jgi:hypothetical protein
VKRVCVSRVPFLWQIAFSASVIRMHYLRPYFVISHYENLLTLLLYASSNYILFVLVIIKAELKGKSHWFWSLVHISSILSIFSICKFLAWAVKEVTNWPLILLVQYYSKFVGFEILTVVNMKSTVIWDVAPVAIHLLLISSFAYSSTMKIDIVHSSVVLVDF